MSGVRQEGILLVDDVGTSGGGAAVDITGPLGPNTAADSISVTLTPEQIPLPVDATITFPPSMVVTATDLDTRNLVFATDKVDVSGSIVDINDSVPIDVNIVSGGSGGGTVDQGTPNTVTNGWPIKITDGTDVAQVVSSNDGLTQTTKGLSVQSINYNRASDGSIQAWIADTGYHAFGSNPYPWVKAMRSTFLSGDTSLNALNAQLNIDIRERTYESLIIYIRNSNLVGTIKFLTNPGNGFNPLQVYNVVTAQWILGELINPTVDTMYMVPCAGLANLYLRVTAYTSGAAVATYSAGPGVGATYANVSGSHVKISDGTDTLAISPTGALTVLIDDTTPIDVNVVSGGGGGTGVITDPIGSHVIADSVSVAIASDQVVPITGSVTTSGTATVSATNLDIRDLVFATDKVDVSGSTLNATVSGTVTTSGTVAVTNFPATQPISGTVSVVEPVTVDAADLDIRNLTFAQDKVDVSGSSITTSGTATVSGTVAVSNFPATQPISGSVSVSNFPVTQPVSGSVIVSGSVSVSNFPATQPVSATNLDIRDLIFATDKVDVSGSTLTVSNFPAVQDVAAINLDIRDLLFASDAVNVSGSSVSISNFPATQPISGSISVSNFPATQAVSATDLDIRDLVFSTDKVDVSGSSVSVTGTTTVSGTVTANPTNSGTATQTQVPDSATSVTILASNSSRLGATVINTSTVTLYLRLSSSAATTGNYTVALVSGAYYEVPFRYTGAITGIWISDPNTGNANVTEFTV